MIFEKKGQVLDLGVATEWDDVHATSPSLVYKDNIYYLYYSGYDGSNYRIGLATSLDGVTFTKQGQVLDLGVDGAFDDVGVLCGSVLYKDNLFYMYYIAHDGSVVDLGLATSKDGKTFSKQGEVYSLNFANNIDLSGRLSLSVLYRNNQYMIYYVMLDGATYKINLITSPEGGTWTDQGIVLTIGAGGAWDDAHLFGLSAIYKDNLYYLFYTGHDGSNYRVGLATSPDGVTFTKQGQVLDLGADGAFDDVGVLCGSVLHKDNLFKLYYISYCGSTYRIGLAVSNCTPLRIHEWRAQYASGTLNFLPGLNDGGDD